MSFLRLCCGLDPRFLSGNQYTRFLREKQDGLLPVLRFLFGPDGTLLVREGLRGDAIMDTLAVYLGEDGF